MQTVNSLFDKLLREDLEKQIEEKAYNLANGTCPTFDDYRFQVGIVTGLRLAIDACDFVSGELAKR